MTMVLTKKGLTNPVEKKDLGGTINQIIPPLGLQYIPTTPNIANVQAVAALEAAKQENEKKVQEARAKLMPDDKAAQEFFKNVNGLNGEVSAFQQMYNQERNAFYENIQKDADYVFSPQGKQHLRKLSSIASNENLNRLKNNKETFDNDRKKVMEKGTGDDIYFDNGYVHIEDPATGQTQKINASQYISERNNPESPFYKANALTINSNFNRINNRVLNTRGELPAMSSQLSYTDAVKELERAFEDLGGTSSENVRSQFTSFGVTNDGEAIPSIAKIASKVGGNTRQLEAAMAIVKDNLSLPARNAIAAELVRRGVDPANTNQFINNLSTREAQKRMNIDSSQSTTYDPMMGALKDKASGSKDAGSFLGFTPAVEVNGSFSGSADTSWFNFWSDDNVDGVIKEESQSFPIDKTLQKNVSVNTGYAYKIGGDNDSPNNDGRMVKIPTLQNVVQSNPISSYVFTGQEIDPKTGKAITKGENAGKMVLTGDKGTVDVKSIQDLQQGQDENGEYVYDPDTETKRYVTRRGFRVYNKVDDDGKPTKERFFVPVNISESRLMFGREDRSGQLANIKFVNSGNFTSQGQNAVQYLTQKIQDSVKARDTDSAQQYSQQYQMIKQAKDVITNPKSTAEQKGQATNALNQILSEIYYDAHGESLINNMPGIKPVATPQSVNVMGQYQ